MACLTLTLRFCGRIEPVVAPATEPSRRRVQFHGPNCPFVAYNDVRMSPAIDAFARVRPTRAPNGSVSSKVDETLDIRKASPKHLCLSNAASHLKSRSTPLRQFLVPSFEKSFDLAERIRVRGARVSNELQRRPERREFQHVHVVRNMDIYARSGDAIAHASKTH